jgi:trimeric autotransporter adhesin
MIPELLKKSVAIVAPRLACRVQNSAGPVTGTVAAFVILLALLATPAAGWGATPAFTVANNTFASTTIGQSSTRSVTVTVNTAVAIKSIAVGAGFTEYKLGAISGCKVDGATVNTSGTVCTVSVTFTPAAPGSLASPAVARSAPLVITDIESGSPVAYAFGLMGAASGPIVQFTPATLTRIAGAAASGYAAGDQGLGQVANGYGGDNGPATAATFSFQGLFGGSTEPSQSMAVDNAGNVFLVDSGNYIIRRVDGTSGTVTTVAGTPKSTGHTGDGGAATSALLGTIGSLALDAGDNIYFSDNGGASNEGSYLIRMVNAGTGILSTIAGQNLTLPYSGTGTCVESGQSYTWEPTCGDGGLATYAFIYDPIATVLDAAGNIYILEEQGTIRKIDATTGIISTLGNAVPSGTGSGFGMAMGADGNLYAAVYDANPGNDFLTQIDPASGVATKVGGGATTVNSATCTEQGSPATDWLFGFNDGYSEGLSADGAGNIYGNTGECYDGLYGEISGGIGSFRFNIATGLAYAFTFTDTPGGNGTNNGVFDSFGGSYAIEPAFAVPDSAGNVYFQTFNQVAKLGGSQGALSGFGSRYDFQTDAAGTPCTQSGSFCETATIANVGNAPLDTSFALSSGFSYLTTGDSAACTSATLAPGDFCNLDIEFTPLTVGTVNGTLTVTDNAGTQGAGTQTLALVGTGAGAAKITYAPGTIAFANQAINTTSAAQTVTISNPGTAALSLSGIFVFATGSNYGVFTITGGTCPLASGSLAAASSCTVMIAFAPTATGSFSAYLNVNNNTGSGSLAATTLTGTGVTAPPQLPQAVLKPTSLPFPNTQLGATAKLSTTLSNPGNATLTGIAASIGGANPSLFSIDPASTCTATLAAGDSCIFTVDFLPTEPITYAATLSVADNATGSPQTASLSGTGMEPTPASIAQLQFTPTVLNLLAGNSKCSVANPITPGPAIDAPICAAVASVTDSQGNEYIVDQDYNSVFKVDAAGNISVFAGVPTIGNGSYGGDNGPAASALLSTPIDVVVDSADNLYISDYGNSRIRKVDATTGTITTFAGYGKLGFFNGGTTTTAALGGPQGMTFDPFGNLYVSNGFGMLVLKIDTSGNVTLFAGEQVDSGSTAGEGIAGYTGDGGKAIDATLSDPQGLASDALGNIYIADTNNYVIRKVDTSGIITTVAGNHTQGNTGDGGPATSAEINAVGVSTDLAGGLYITGGGNGSGNLVRKVDTSGNISTYAGGGTGSTGGPATSAQLSSPYFARVDLNGDLIIPTGKTVDVGGPQGILQFGSQGVNTTSAPLTLTLTNTGNATLHFTSLTGSNFGAGAGTITGDFAIASSGTCAFATLNSGATCTIDVTFTPTATGARAGTITLSTDAPNAPNIVQLTGTGTQAFVAATPVITPATGTYTANQTVTITDSTSGASIYYTTDGNMPSTNSTLYTAPFIVSRTGTNVQAIAVASGYTNSAVAVATYTLQAITPVLNPPGGTYTGSQSVAITTATPGATIYYTTNGIAPSTESAVYNGPIPVTTSGTTIEAIAALSGYNNSPAVSGTYIIGAPAVTLAPTSLNFNSQPEGTPSAAQTVTLKNTGSATLTGIVISLSENPQEDVARAIRSHAAGISSTDYSATTTCGSTLTAGSSCAISVTFTPHTVGSFPAILSVTDNASNSPQTIQLSGTGTYVMPQVTLLPATLSFGSVTEGTTSAAQAVTLKNIGTSPFTITSTGFGGAGASDFALNTSAGTCGTTLAAGASCVYSITFTPAAATNYSGTFQVSDYPDGENANVSLTGTGTVPSAPIASLTPASLTFSSNTDTASAVQTATLSNTGNASLTISGISLAGANPSDFSQTNNCGESLAAGASCTISMTFTPASATSFTATLAVADNAAGSPQTTTLNGTGITPTGDFSVNATPLSQTVTAGAAATFNIVVATTPAGDDFSNAVTLTATGLPAGATAAFSPASVTPGTGSGSSTLTIQTVAPATTTTAANRPGKPGSPWPIVAPSMAFLFGGFTLLFWRKQHARALRRLSMVLILGGLGLASLAVMGCGGGFALPAAQGQTYTITVTGTAGTDTHSTTVTLTVN